MNHSRMISNMRNVLAQRNLIDQFKQYTPPKSTGYAYDISPIIKTLKKEVSVDKHSDSSFAVCCNRLKKSLLTKISSNHYR